MDISSLMETLESNGIQCYISVDDEDVVSRVSWMWMDAIFTWYRHASGAPMIHISDNAVGLDLTARMMGDDEYLLDYLSGLRSRIYTLPVPTCG